MRRSLVICLLLLGAVAPAAQAGPPSAPAKARLVACTTGADSASRAATFRGSMQAIRGTRRMAMKFVLLERRPGQAHFHRVDAPNWGEWERSSPRRPAFIYEKRVEALRAPSTYKATIHFRWYDRDGDLLVDAESRATRPCRQPDPRPNVTLGHVEGRRVSEGFAYFLTVLNVGLQAAPTFAVTLTINGEPQPPVTVGPLAGGTSEMARIDAPRCTPGSTIKVSLDTGDAVDESREGDNAVTRPCPFEGR